MDAVSGPGRGDAGRVSTDQGIPDRELAVRIGSLDRAAREAVERIATDAFLWRCPSQAESLDSARGRQWRALGGSAGPTSRQLLRALALRELGEENRRSLGATPDVLVASRSTPPGPDDLCEWARPWTCCAPTNAIRSAEPPRREGRGRDGEAGTRGSRRLPGRDGGQAPTVR